MTKNFSKLQTETKRKIKKLKEYKVGFFKKSLGYIIFKLQKTETNRKP